MGGHDLPDDGQAKARALAAAGLKRLNRLVLGAVREAGAVVVDRNAAAAQINRDALRAVCVDQRVADEVGERAANCGLEGLKSASTSSVTTERSIGRLSMA